VGKIPRTKGAKNKKTLLKEKKIQKIVNDTIKTTGKPVVVESIVIPEEPKQRIAIRLFTLEKKVHDDFIKYVSQFGDSKLYESYIVNELMVKYTTGKIKPLKIDKQRLGDYMRAYGHVGFEAGTVVEELTELKAANRLLHKPQNSFIQFQYPIVVDHDVKSTFRESPSYVVNELLKMYIKEEIKVDTRDFRIKEWEPKYKYVIKKESKSK
jgi:hypothetical protein